MAINSIKDIEVKDSTVLVRVDYNIALNSERKIVDGLRIRTSLPTLKKLLENNNKLILCAHLGDPKDRDASLSLSPVVDILEQLIELPVTLVTDFTTPTGKDQIKQQKREIIMLENLRFWPGEVENDEEFSKSLASLAQVFVQDAFGVCHREHASVVGVPKFLPSYAGLLLKNEIETINAAIENPMPPTIAILGGAKISTKIKMLYKLIDKAQILLLGGGMANTFLHAQGIEVGASLFEKEEAKEAIRILKHGLDKKTAIILPIDAIVKKSSGQITTKMITEIDKEMTIGDIGVLTREKFAEKIKHGKTIIWNGPMGKVEEPVFQAGNNAIFKAIISNSQALSIVGGGDTIASLSRLDGVDKISHLSTGGGAMIEFIEKGTLPGIEALKD